METDKLGKKFDSFRDRETTVKPRPNQPSGLETDITRILNPEWLDSFLAFMEMSHLPPDRLYDWARALLTLYPANAQKVDRRLPLSIDAITGWQMRMYDKKVTEHRKKYIAEFERPGALTCCLATIPIVRNQQKKAGAPLGTLIIAFERRSETLIHNIVRHEATPMEVLLLAHKVAQLAIKRLGQTGYAEARRYLVMPGTFPRTDWRNQLTQLFESNRPHFASSDRLEAVQKACHLLGIEVDKNSLRCHVQGQKFSTRLDLWWPVDYVNERNPSEICCADDENTVH